MSQKSDHNNICFFKISIAGVVQPQPIVIQLDTANCPKTCQNFMTLCTSREATSRNRPQPSYRGCEFHRIIENFMVQGGDFERFDGTGGYCVIGDATKQRNFDDEYLKGKHSDAGILSMANAGKNTNGSQFFITLKATPHLDGKHVVFGHVLQGMETVMKMTTVERQGDRPVNMQKIVICDCGMGDGSQNGENDDSSSRSDKDDHHHRRRKHKKHEKKKKKKHKKHHSSSRKHHRRHDYSDEEDDSSRDLSSSESDRPRRKRKERRRHDRRRERDYSSDSESYSSSSGSDHRRKRKRHQRDERHKKHKKRHH